jgi:hypothetical protein
VPSSRSEGTRVSSRPSQVRMALRVAAAPRAATALSNAETIERPQGIRKESDSCADRVNARRPLQHGNLIARLPQGDRGAQSGDSCGDDDHTHGVIIWRQVAERNSRRA